MKKVEFICTIGLLLIYTLSFAGDAQIAAALKQASSESGRYKLDANIQEQLLSNYHLTSDITKTKIASLPENGIKDQIDSYLTIKERASVGGASSNGNFQDFKWEYIGATNSELVPVTIQADHAVRIRNVSAGAFQIPINKNFQAGDPLALVVPKTDNELILSVATDKGRITWTIPGKTNSNILLLPIEFPQGCRVQVSSIPKMADVFFNGTKFHEHTDTEVARSPGKCRVVIQKAGYKPWKAERELADGEVWPITAELTPLR